MTRLGSALIIVGAGALAAGLVGGAVRVVFGFPLGWAILCAGGALLLVSGGTLGLMLAYEVNSSVWRDEGTAPEALAHCDVRRTLIAHRRVGDELISEAARYRRYGHGLVSEADAQDWAGSVLRFLFENGSPQAQERFLTAGTGPACERMAARVLVLRELIKEWPRDR